MRAAIINAPGTDPVFGTFRDPVAADGLEVVRVQAAAITHLTKGRASGSHYSSDNAFPAVPGTDGVGILPDGRRVYFALPEAPFGALAELSLVDPRHTVAVPDALDTITAAALANPGMSAWAALVERAKFVPGETVLINGATGSAGTIAVQLAKHLGAKKILVAGRNLEKLEALKPLGADSFLDTTDTNFERILTQQFAEGIDVVLDYLWGATALSIFAAIAKGAEDTRPVRFIQIGAAAGDSNLSLPAQALRSSSVVLMGSGLKSVPLPALLNGIGEVFKAAASLQIDTATLPLEEIAQAWKAPGNPRMVVTI